METQAKQTDIEYRDREIDEELADVLTAISVVSKRLARKLTMLSRQNEQKVEGTGDCLVIADGTLHIVDYKHGQGVLVESEGNQQMMLYALGTLEIFDGIYDIDTFSITIYQPRRDNVFIHTVFAEAVF